MADVGESEPAFLIAAARQAVRRSSIRAVAAQVGMSPGGLFNLVTGRTRVLFGTTVDKLRTWYLHEWVAGADGLAPEVVSYLVQQLLAPIEREERRGAVLELRGALERIYDSHGTPRPVWLGEIGNE